MVPVESPVVLGLADPEGPVLAMIEAGRPADDVLSRAVEEAAAGAHELVVVQLVDDPSVLRRGVAKAELARDVAWWSRDLTGVATWVDVVDAQSFDVAVARLHGAARAVMAAETLVSERGLSRLGRRVLAALGADARAGA